MPKTPFQFDEAVLWQLVVAKIASGQAVTHDPEPRPLDVDEVVALVGAQYVHALAQLRRGAGQEEKRARPEVPASGSGVRCPANGNKAGTGPVAMLHLSDDGLLTAGTSRTQGGDHYAFVNVDEGWSIADILED